jgi:POT family proton-dependent oligopeptide transporter
MDRAKKGHPPGLYVLFGAEAWERFSFYGMRGLLVLYLVNQLSFERSDALHVYATYLLLVYLTPLLGGYLADRYLGARKAIITGGIVMALGQWTLVSADLLYYGLGLIIAGNGFFKPNISTIVSSLYDEDDPRRDGAFTIFYMGINVGAFFAPLVCGFIGETIHWGLGFATAGFGMVVGLIMFVGGQRLLGTAGFPPGREVTKASRLLARDWRDIFLLAAAVVALVIFTVTAGGMVQPYWATMSLGSKVGVAAVLLAFSILWGRRRGQQTRAEDKFTTEEWQRIAVVLIISVFVIFFWMGFEQAGGTMNLFADQQTDRHVWGWEVPASWFQSVNPLFIVILAPLFSWIWARNDSSRFGISTPAKMALGMIVLGLGFVIMYFGQQVADSQGTAGLGWLLGVYLLHTMGELCLSPIGLSLVTKLSPPRIVSLMMGAWFACTALADYLAGVLESILEHFHLPLWGTLIATSFGAGLALLALTPLLKKWMHGRG